jgi:cytochrome c biogenesis protein CcdA
MQILKKIWPLLVVGVLVGLFFLVRWGNQTPEDLVTVTEEVYPVNMIVFHSDTCHFCKDELEFIEKELSQEFPNLKLQSYEVSGFKNGNLFKKVVESKELSGGVPVTIIGDEHWTGFSEKSMGDQLRSKIWECSQEACYGEAGELLNLEKPSEKTEEEITLPRKILEQESASTGGADSGTPKSNQVTFLGNELEVNESHSIAFWAVVLGVLDGVNPCMFSVLIFLLTYLLGVGSRKKALKAGLVFAAVTFVVYFSLMLGIFQIVSVLEISSWVRYIAIGIALVLGALMIKDYFFYGKWISLAIPEKHKPTIEKLAKKGTYVSVALLALFASLVELPCTSGIPIAFTSILTQKEVSPVFYLALYNFFFIAPLLVIVASVAFAWAKVEKWEQFRKQGRETMRLVAGIALLLLALAMWQNWI